MALWLMLSGFALGEAPVTMLNASGVSNRPVSVDPIGHSEGFSAVLYNNMNGLPTSEANAIAETSDGFIWIGSYAGLIRYDGNTFERMDSTSGISSVKCLYVDSHDRLWVGTNDNGVAVMERGEMRMWGKLDGMRSAHTRAITEDHNGNIYVATTSGVMMFDPDFNLSVIEGEELVSANMRDIRIGADGIIYGVTDSGDILRIRDGKLLSFFPIKQHPLAGSSAILPDPNQSGVIYTETGDFGFYRVDVSEGFEVLEKLDIAPLTYVRQLEYIDGKLWICAGNGIGVLDEDGFHLLENLPMNNNVGHVMTDYLGNLWFTSTRQGVMKVVPNQFTDVFQRYDLSEAVVNSTCMDDEGRLFVGTDMGLMVIDENGPMERLPLKRAKSASGSDLAATDLIEYLNGARIRSIIKDSQGRLWFSNWRAQGLVRYDHGTMTVFTISDGLMSLNLRSIAERDDGAILLALTGGVQVIQNNRIVKSYGEADGIQTTESLTVEAGLNNEIILGSNGGGLYIIDDDGVKNINVEEGLPSDIVMRIRRDKKRNVVWLITSSALAYMDADHKVTTVQKFPYTNNFDLYENSKGDMWVLSSNGIYVVPGDELVANGGIEPVFYGIANGLSCIATANSYSALSTEGDLYIAGTTGICKVNIEKPIENVNDLKAAVPFVDVDGHRIYPDEDGSFTVPANTQKLTIPSFVFNYSLNNPQVSLKFEGFDRESTTVSRQDMVPVDYTNLRGGTYHYVMQLKDAMGRGNKEVSVKIVKEKKLYEKTWFIVLCGLLFLVMLEEAVRFYVYKKTQKLEKRHRETMALIGEISEAFAKVIDMKDKYTNGHSTRVAKYTTMLAKELGYDDETVEKYYRIALLHDIGKIGVPPEVLNKAGKLTDEEFEIIKSHTTLGYDALKDISIMPELAIGAQAHHERPDGRGYPNHLKGEEIPRVAQIIAVADCFDAMYSN
ncbi:MAG: HD domain-containing phosphohydrolase, partial [bacterium]